MQLARAKELAQQMEAHVPARTSYSASRGASSAYVRGDAMRALHEACVGAGAAAGHEAAAGGVVALRSSLSAAHAEANELRVAQRRLEAELGMIAHAADEVVLLEEVRLVSFRLRFGFSTNSCFPVC